MLLLLGILMYRVASINHFVPIHFRCHEESLLSLEMLLSIWFALYTNESFFKCLLRKINLFVSVSTTGLEGRSIVCSYHFGN